MNANTLLEANRVAADTKRKLEQEIEEECDVLIKRFCLENKQEIVDVVKKNAMKLIELAGELAKARFLMNEEAKIVVKNIKIEGEKEEEEEDEEEEENVIRRIVPPKKCCIGCM